MDTRDLPRNLIEFEERFATEAACIAYVRAKKWPDGFRCLSWGGRDSWPVRGGRLEEYAAPAGTRSR